MDITLKELKNINDLYKDGTTFVEILEKPQKPAEGDFRPGMTYSTASPFTDSKIKLHIKLQVDDEVLHDDFDSEPVTYEMEDYHMPAVLRRVLKMSKLNKIPSKDMLITMCLTEPLGEEFDSLTKKIRQHR